MIKQLCDNKFYYGELDEFIILIIIIENINYVISILRASLFPETLSYIRPNLDIFINHKRSIIEFFF